MYRMLCSLVMSTALYTYTQLHLSTMMNIVNPTDSEPVHQHLRYIVWWGGLIINDSGQLSKYLIKLAWPGLNWIGSDCIAEVR